MRTTFPENNDYEVLEAGCSDTVHDCLVSGGDDARLEQFSKPIKNFNLVPVTTYYIDTDRPYAIGLPPTNEAVIAAMSAAMEIFFGTGEENGFDGLFDLLQGDDDEQG